MKQIERKKYVPIGICLVAALTALAGTFCPYDDKDTGKCGSWLQLINTNTCLDTGECRHNHECASNRYGNGGLLNCSTTSVTCDATLTQWGGTNCSVRLGTITVSCGGSATIISGSVACPPSS